MSQGSETKVQAPLVELLPRFTNDFNLGEGQVKSISKSAVIARIIDVPSPSTRLWFFRGIQPTGERRSKLTLLMSLFGYVATERAELDKTMLTFADTIATVIDVDKAIKETGFSRKKITAWLRGDEKPRRLEEVSSFLRRHSKEKEERINLWKEELRKCGFAITPSPDVLAFGPNLRVVQSGNDGNVSTLIQGGALTKEDEVLVSLLKALRVQVGSTGVLFDDVRKKTIRRAMGHAEFADLIGDLQKLSMAHYDKSSEGK